MEYRQLGGSGFKVPVLSLGTGTFGGTNEFFKGFGTSGAEEARRVAGWQGIAMLRQRFAGGIVIDEGSRHRSSGC